MHQYSSVQLCTITFKAFIIYSQVTVLLDVAKQSFELHRV